MTIQQILVVEDNPDIMLPEMDGLDVVKSLKGQKIPIPVILLTSRSSEIDRVLVLELGADKKNYHSSPVPRYKPACPGGYRPG